MVQHPAIHGAITWYRVMLPVVRRVMATGNGLRSIIAHLFLGFCPDLSDADRQNKTYPMVSLGGLLYMSSLSKIGDPFRG